MSSEREPIHIGNRAFKNKSEAAGYFRRLLSGGAVTGDAAAELMDLLAMHPDAERKIGPGVERFEVRQQGRNRCFWVVRVDGSETDFSFLKCLSASRADPMARFLSAARRAVAGQARAVRDAAFRDTATLICPITEEPFTVESCHIDHHPRPFVFWARLFVCARGRIPATRTHEDGQVGEFFADEDDERAWVAFHAAAAEMRAVSAAGNLRKPRK